MRIARLRVLRLRPAALGLIVLLSLGAVIVPLFAQTAPLDASEKAPTLAELQATRSRPLFSPTRRPPPPVIKPVVAPVSVVAPPQIQPPPDAQLTGIIIGSAMRIAVLKLKSTSKTIEVKPGDVLDGWKVLEIGPQSIDVESKTSRLTLELQRNTGLAASTDINKFVSPRNMSARPINLPLGLPPLKP